MPLPPLTKSVKLASGCFEARMDKELRVACLVYLPPEDPDDAWEMNDENFKALATEIIRRGFKNIEMAALLKAMPAILEARAEPFVFARATEPVHGEDGRVRCHFEERPAEKIWSASEDAQLDFRQRYEMNNVEAEALLAELLPPTQGTDGMDVLGKPIRSKPGREAHIKAGKNVRLSADHQRAYAEIAGCVKILRNTVIVDNIKVIRGNVDFHSGNIDFKGDVIIRGDVLETFSVRADGDIKITGTVDRAGLEAGCNIYVEGGIYGKDEVGVRAGGDISLGFAENAQLEAGGAIYVKGAMVNCQALAREKVYLKSTGKSLVGGRLRAYQGVVAYSLGNSNVPTKTVIEFGMNPETKKRLQEIDQALERYEEASKDGAELGEEERAEQDELLREIQLLHQEYERQLIARVYARHRTYPGVELINGKASYKVNAIIDNMMFYRIESRNEILMRRCKGEKIARKAPGQPAR